MNNRANLNQLREENRSMTMPSKKIVAKFGGSSLSSAEQFKKVKQIIESDNSRNCIVVSAPGKRFSGDTKVTDLLIQLSNLQNEDSESSQTIQSFAI